MDTLACHIQSCLDEMKIDEVSILWVSIVVNGEVCDDLDTDVCQRLKAIRSNMCSDPCLSSICNRTCGMCPVKCYKCHEIDHPANCTNLVDCPSNDHFCFTTQTFTDDFLELYTMGCAIKDICQLNVNNSKRADLKAKGGCCNMDKCNNKLPDEIDLIPLQTTVMPISTTASQLSNAVCENLDNDICLRISLADPAFCSNPCIASNICPRMCRKCFQCYECNDIDSPENCNITKTCTAGRECFQLETLSIDLRPVYRLGCLDESLCQRFGSPVQNGFGKRQDISLRGGCCKTDLCNHGKIQHIVSTTPEPSTTTAKDCQTTDRHHCPIGYTYEVHSHSCYYVGSEKLTWMDSQRFCQSQCGRLSDFSSSHDLISVLSHISASLKSENLWTDAVKDKSGHWVWSHNHGRLDNDFSRFLSFSSRQCAATSSFSIFSKQAGIIPENCTLKLFPLCEADRH